MAPLRVTMPAGPLCLADWVVAAKFKGPWTRRLFQGYR